MVEKVKDIEFVDQPAAGYSEEELQSIKSWIDHPLTQNLSNHLKEIIETEKKNWLFGGYIIEKDKALGDYNAGYAKGLLYIVDFIENGGVGGIKK